eukprot:353182-Chlamydomonas_euryale.AAC.9
MRSSWEVNCERDRGCPGREGWRPGRGRPLTLRPGPCCIAWCANAHGMHACMHALRHAPPEIHTFLCPRSPSWLTSTKNSFSAWMAAFSTTCDSRRDHEAKFRINCKQEGQQKGRRVPATAGCGGHGDCSGGRGGGGAGGGGGSGGGAMHHFSTRECTADMLPGPPFPLPAAVTPRERRGLCSIPHLVLGAVQLPQERHRVVCDGATAGVQLRRQSLHLQQLVLALCHRAERPLSVRRNEV